MASRVSEIQGQVASIRRKPISDDLRSLLETVAAETGVNFEITSGGQSPFGEGPRTGSTRHDDGNAADLKAYVVEDGNKRYLNINNDADRAKWSEIVRLSVAGGATGIGAGNGSDYMGAHTVHIGYGKPMTWGHKGKSANAPDWLKEAYDLGGKTPPLPIAGPAPTPADMSNRIQMARLGADDAGIGTAFSQLERFGQPGATPVTMSDELAYGSGRVRDVPLPRARPSGPMADVPLPQPRPSAPTTSSPPSMFPGMSRGIVDATRSPTLFAEGVGIPNDQIPGTDATYGAGNRMSTGGLGALLGRSFSPATPNPAPRPQSTITGRPNAPVGSMPAYRAPTPAPATNRPGYSGPTRMESGSSSSTTTARPLATQRPIGPIGITGTPGYAPPPPLPPKTITTTRQVANPAYYAAINQASPSMAAMGFSPGTMPNIPKTITQRVSAPNPAYQSALLAQQRAQQQAPTPATQSAGLAARRVPYTGGDGGLFGVPISRDMAASQNRSSGSSSQPRSTTRVLNSSGTGSFGTSSSGRRYNPDTNTWEVA